MLNVGWKHALPISCAVAVIVFFGLWRIEVAETRNLKAQVDTLQDTILEREADLDKCVQNKIIAEEIQGEHARKISNLNKQLNDFKRLRDPKNARCVNITR